VTLLAIETSSRVGSLALYADDRLIAAQQFEHGLQNAARMLPLLDAMLREQHLRPPDIHAVCVSQGPGSFTGLRVGITLAKTLCFATGAKLVAVPSLEVIAHNAPAPALRIMPVLDARRGQVFAALY
jgi:tRNA threonylcarbamoyladenosine biosynthesis protein TsaB